MKVVARFIPSGRYEVTRTAQDKLARERIETEVREQFSVELARYKFLQRLIVATKIRREIRRRLDEIAPARACY